MRQATIAASVAVARDAAALGVARRMSTTVLPPGRLGIAVRLDREVLRFIDARLGRGFLVRPSLGP